MYVATQRKREEAKRERTMFTKLRMNFESKGQKLDLHVYYCVYTGVYPL